MWHRIFSFRLFLVIIAASFLFACTGGNNDLEQMKTRLGELQKRVESLESYQKEAKKILDPIIRRRKPIDFNKVYKIPEGISPVKGPDNAPVTIVEFSDFQCPYCSRAAKVMKKIENDFKGKVKFVFKHFPLKMHKFAKMAAYASLSAAKQGKFWEMHDALFENFSSLNEKKIDDLAGSLGIDMEKFKNNILDSEISRGVEKDLNDGRRIGVTGTPTIFVNGKRVRSWQYENLKKLIEEALTAKS